MKKILEEDWREKERKGKREGKRNICRNVRKMKYTEKKEIDEGKKRKEKKIRSYVKPE